MDKVYVLIQGDSEENNHADTVTVQVFHLRTDAVNYLFEIFKEEYNDYVEEDVPKVPRALKRMLEGEVSEVEKLFTLDEVEKYLTEYYDETDIREVEVQK